MEILSWSNICLAIVIMSAVVTLLNIVNKQETDKKKEILETALKEKIINSEDYFGVVKPEEPFKTEHLEAEATETTKSEGK